jgi:hypothetical protein
MIVKSKGQGMSNEHAGIPVMVAAFDVRDTVVFWNEACEHVTGYGASDMVGTPGALDLLCSEASYRGVTKLTGWPRDGVGWPVPLPLHCWDITMMARDGTPRTLVWIEAGPPCSLPGTLEYSPHLLEPASGVLGWLVARHISLLGCRIAPVAGGLSWGMGVEVSR